MNITIIIVVAYVVAMTIIGAFLGICCLKLRKKNERLRQDRNNLIESRADWELEMIRKNLELSDTEKKLICAILYMPETNKEMQAQGLNEIYEHIKRKIKDSIED